MQTLRLTALLCSLLALAPRPAQAACPQDTWAGTTWVTWEADQAARSGDMDLIGNNPGYFQTGSNGNQNDNGNVPSCAAAGCADYSFTLTAADAGYYKIEAQMRADNGNEDSFFVGIVGVNDTCGGNTGGSSGNPAIRRWDVTESNNNVVWRYVTDWNNSNTAANARVWQLGAGNYTIRFIGREEDTRVYRVRLQRLLTGTPATPTYTVTRTQTPSPGTPTLTPTPSGGLSATYFTDMNLTNVGGSRIDSTVNFQWGAASPGFGGLGSDGFSVRWCGRVFLPAAGTYTFYTSSDDGVRLYINGNLIIDRWSDQTLTEWTSSPVTVAGAGNVNLVLEYYDNTGQAQIELRWSSGAIPKEIIPTNRLSEICVVPTPTPTLTQGPPIWGGLPAGKRLNGLEYIPFPEIRVNPAQIHGLSVTFSSQTANNLVRNTSRWRIVLQDLDSTVGNRIQVETRLGAAGEDCGTGYFDPSAYSSATSLTLPDRPQNLSTTYFWVNGAVPVTERFDAMGDPRYMPYADLIGAASNANDLKGGYNWFYKDMRDTGYADYELEYEPFLAQAIYNRYNNQPNFDVPKLFALWREGIVASRSIYTSMTGYSSYYVGVGGEIGGDAANKLSSGGVPAYNGPWGSTGSGGKEEIIGSTVLVRNATWISRPELGELWPDASYASDWYSGGANTTWGNLRNSQQGGNAYRQARQTALNGTATAPYNYEFLQVRHRTEPAGSASFMNGHGGSGQFNHFTNQFNATLMYDGQRMAQDYNFAMPATFNVNRSWGLIQGGNQPNEWNQWPYRDRRIALDIYSAATANGDYNFRGFYRRDGGVDAHQRASAAVRGIESSGVVHPDGLPAAGWFVINGLAPSTDSGINFVARFAILSCLRTFHDAGAPVTFGNTRNQVGPNVFRIATVPLVQITQPKIGQDVTGLGTIVLEWKKRSARWDRARYTENYPCLDVDQPPCTAVDPTKPENPANEWHDSAVLVFNVKYSLDGGGSWFSALTGNPARAGVYMDGGDSLPEVANHLYQYSWDVSGLASGSKLVRVEAYRRDLGLHYAYHEMAIVTAP